MRWPFTYVLRCAAITCLLCVTAIVHAQAPHGSANAASLDTAQKVNPDVAFMQGMIGHHAQALRMTRLVGERTTRKDLRVLAEKIDASQRDEIGMMKRWLTDHEQPVPPDAAEHPMSMEAGMHMAMPALMPGMLTEPELSQLAAAKGAAFDRQFLRFMIRHHEGALTMVARLFGTNGAGQAPDVFRFASDVDADQRVEIKRMKAMLRSPAK